MKVIRQGEGGPANPFEALAGEAAALDQPPGEGGDGAPGEAQAGQAAPVLTNAQCVAMALQMVRETVCGLAKVRSPKTTLDDATINIVADAVAPVLDKYRINLQGAAGGYMVELKAAFTVGPILWLAWAELRNEVRSMQATPVQPEQAPAAPADQAPAGE